MQSSWSCLCLKAWQLLQDLVDLLAALTRLDRNNVSSELADTIQTVHAALLQRDCRALSPKHACMVRPTPGRHIHACP